MYSCQLTPRHSAARKVRIRLLPMMLAAVAVSVGCSSARYRAATLPPHLLAPTATVQEINLANLSGMGNGSTLIGVGDLVELTIASGGDEKKTEPILSRVAEDGNINLALIGEVPVAGVEPFEAGERVAAAAVRREIYRQPTVVFRVDQPAVNQVTVLGAVTKPGVQKLPRGSSDVLNAVAAAGGMTKEASTEVEVLRQRPHSLLTAKRDGNRVVTASHNELLASQTSIGASADASRSLFPEPANLQPYRLNLAQPDPSRLEDYRVGDGDVVMVLPEKDRLIHVSGLVNKPDQFKMPPDQDVYVLDAIAMAGGIKSPVANKVNVIRRLEGMETPEIIEVSISKAKKDGAENLRLAAGDMVSVEATALTHTVDTITTFFRMSLGFGGNFATF